MAAMDAERWQDEFADIIQNDLQDKGMDGDVLAAVKSKSIARLICEYAEIDESLIYRSIDFAIEAFGKFYLGKSKNNLCDFDEYLIGRSACALDFVAYQTLCEVWKDAYFSAAVHARQVLVSKSAARKRAAIHHANGPKAVAKAAVYESWRRWRSNPKLYRSKSAFAQAMLDTHDNLNSQQTIERWCRAWERSE
ncbi:hypothetical protein [Burkholderia lata]|uniref:hypothetical protein n=1 Tax=Burkholderia lata (strain ATCC 17760 / DSM 23089 / LMG 22485 / NCIMB 9086 / R18194 / 383) TaxID=482957 RepID=UPI00158402D0|nr:hypothetical protein [Burkholderia lata]